MKGQNIPQEKDFIILNLSKGYVLHIEVKENVKKYQSAIKQFHDGRESLMKIFNSIENMSQDWKYIGMFYASLDSSQPLFDCQICHPWTILKKENIQSKLEHMESRLNPGWNPTEHLLEFVELIKEIMFIAQGDPKAPVTQAMQVNKLSQNIDQNTKFFWTPEQLGITDGSNDAPWMLLFAYYGCGKTWCLKERAKYLLKSNQKNVVHFFLAKHRKDIDESLLDDLSLYFKNTSILPKGLSIKFSYSNKRGYLAKELKEAGVQPSHHVLLDEYTVIDPQAFVQDLKEVKGQVASLWIATTAINSKSDPKAFRQYVSDQAGFICPELNDCLRNSKEIVRFAATLQIVRIHSCQQLKKEVKLNHSPGLFFRFDQVSKTPMEALERAFEKSPVNKKCLVVITYANVHFKHFEQRFPDMIFKDFADPKQRKNWITTDKYEILLFIFINYYREKIRGIEVDSMIYIYPQCAKCLKHTIFPEFVTRAKVTLILSSFQYCEKCK